MSEIICVNALFPVDYLEFYKEHGVVTPQQDKMYTIREVRRDTSKIGSTDNIGFLLEEIVNPKVPVTTPLLGTYYTEVSFAHWRFRHLNGDEITIDSLREMIKESLGLKVPEKDKLQILN